MMMLKRNMRRSQRRKYPRPLRHCAMAAQLRHVSSSRMCVHSRLKQHRTMSISSGCFSAFCLLERLASGMVCSGFVLFYFILFCFVFGFVFLLCLLFYIYMYIYIYFFTAYSFSTLNSYSTAASQARLSSSSSSASSGLCVKHRGSPCTSVGSSGGGGSNSGGTGICTVGDVGNSLPPQVCCSSSSGCGCSVSSTFSSCFPTGPYFPHSVSPPLTLDAVEYDSQLLPILDSSFFPFEWVCCCVLAGWGWNGMGCGYVLCRSGSDIV